VRRMSANVWRTEAGTLLRPCEMPAEQVLEVLRALPDPSSGDPEPEAPAR